MRVTVAARLGAELAAILDEEVVAISTALRSAVEGASPRLVAQAASAPSRRQARQSAKRKLRSRSCQLGGVLRAGLVAGCVAGERGGRHVELVRHEGEHRRGRVLARPEARAEVAQQAELHSEAKPVHCAPPGSDDPEVCRVQDVVPSHLGAFGGDAEQARACLGGQQGAAGHVASSAQGRDAVRKPVAFRGRRERGYRKPKREDLPWPGVPCTNLRLRKPPPTPRRACCSATRGSRRAHRRAPAEARCNQVARDRRKRHLGPQDRRRDGAPVRDQPADGVADRRRAPDGQPRGRERSGAMKRRS